MFYKNFIYNNAVISKRDSDNELVTVEDEGKREKRRAGRLREDPDSIFGRPLGVRDEYHRRGYRGRGERHHERRRRHRDGRGHHHGHRGHYHCHHHHHHNRTTTIISKITTMPIVITTKTTTPVTTQTTTSIQKHRKRNLEDYKTLYK
uniref:Uncharacterized protein n=1 Tax=Strongyloides venezuelensis TaxID=75913 RepID=A0A0K0FTW0_STRVS